MANFPYSGHCGMSLEKLKRVCPEDWMHLFSFFIAVSVALRGVGRAWLLRSCTLCIPRFRVEGSRVPHTGLGAQLRAGPAAPPGYGQHPPSPDKLPWGGKTEVWIHCTQTLTLLWSGTLCWQYMELFCTGTRSCRDMEQPVEKTILAEIGIFLSLKWSCLELFSSLQWGTVPARCAEQTVLFSCTAYPAPGTSITGSKARMQSLFPQKRHVPAIPAKGALSHIRGWCPETFVGVFPSNLQIPEQASCTMFVHCMLGSEPFRAA